MSKEASEPANAQSTNLNKISIQIFGISYLKTKKQNKTYYISERLVEFQYCQ